jgi:hypothetical protein
MKAILGTLAISVLFPMSLSAQVGSGGGAAGSAAGSSVGAVSGARSAGVAGTGAISPTGALAGQTPAGAGTVATPAGTPVGTPGTAAPIGPINPGGISARPPAVSGRTFDRSTIGGGPTDAIVDPTGVQPTFRFPPASTLPTPVVTNTVTGADGFPAPTFPSGPVGVNNTVGTNFGAVLSGTVPREPVAINLPPGTRVVTNAFGVSEVVAPPPVAVGTNVGAPAIVEIGTNRAVVVPRVIMPPQPPRVSRGPILDSRTPPNR